MASVGRNAAALTRSLTGRQVRLGYECLPELVPLRSLPAISCVGSAGQF